MEQGRTHFERALTSGKHRLFVRDYQWSGLSNLKRQTSTGDEDHIVVRAEQLKMILQMLVNDKPWVTGRSDRMPRETIEAYGQPYRARYDWFDKVWPALEPEQHLQLVTTMAAEFAEDSFLWPLSQLLLGRIQEQLNNHEQALAYYQKLDAFLPARDKLREPVDTALERLTGQQPAYALLRTDPLAFHTNSLANKAFEHPDYALAISYFDELVGKVYYQQELDKVEVAIDALKTGSERLALWLEQFVGSQKAKDDLIDVYWNLSGELGELLLYQRALDDSVAQFKMLAEDSRLRRWMQMDAYYNLACSLSLRSLTDSGEPQEREQDKEQAVASLLKTIEFGYNKWEHIKRDADLDAIRDHPDYIRVMTGR